jgi:hypothetical protein
MRQTSERPPYGLALFTLIVFVLTLTVVVKLTATSAEGSWPPAAWHPDSTRFDGGGGSYATTVTFAADEDTTVWLGFKASTGTVLRVDADVSVQPILDTSNTLTDPSPIWGSGKRIYANPRADSLAFEWGPDTLTAARPVQDYCCGELLGYRVIALGTAGEFKIYASTGQGGAMGLDVSGSGAGTGSGSDTTVVSPAETVENTGQREALRGNGVTLTSGAWSYTSVQDGSDFHRAAIYLSWSNNFTDSMIVVVRRHWDLDVTVPYAVDLDPSTLGVRDSVLAYVKDSGGLGGTDTYELVDRFGNPLYLPKFSIGLYHDGTGNVSTLKLDLEKRRDW